MVLQGLCPSSNCLCTESKFTMLRPLKGEVGYELAASKFYSLMVLLRLLTHVGFLRQNCLILSKVFLYMERSKNQEKKYVNCAKKFHLPEEV